MTQARVMILGKASARLCLAVLLTAAVVCLLYRPPQPASCDGAQYPAIAQRMGEDSIGLVSLNTGEVRNLSMLDEKDYGYTRISCFTTSDFSSSIICHPNNYADIQVTLNAPANPEQAADFFGSDVRRLAGPNAPSLALVDFVDGTIYSLRAWPQRLHHYVVIAIPSGKSIRLLCLYRPQTPIK